jgi:hypothetical protein
MGRAGYTDDEYEEGDVERWRKAVNAAIRDKDGQALLKEMLAALDALPRKRLIANRLEEVDWNDAEDELVPVKDGDVCAVGALGRARGVAMPVIDEEDDWEAAEEIQGVFGSDDHLTREIMYQNDECGSGRKVPLPQHASPYGFGTGFEYAYKHLDETPEERFQRMRRWVLSRISKGDHYPNGG